jgi:hypothetical protein
MNGFGGQALMGGSPLMLGIGKEDSHPALRVDGETEPLPPEQFPRIIPTGSLEGYH